MDMQKTWNEESFPSPRSLRENVDIHISFRSLI